jgi:hypothetical protein
MKRIIFVIAIVVLLAAVPALADKKNRPIIQPPPGIRPAAVLIQADGGEGYMTFNLTTGAFNCFLCEYGYEFKGIGNVKIDGCNVYFSVVTDAYSMFSSVNMCDRQAKCVVEVYQHPDKTWDIAPLTELLVDSNMADSKAECLAVPEK